MSEFDGDSVTIAVAGTQRAQIRLEIVPSALPPHNENRTGDLTINVTGTVGPPGTLQGPSSALADRDGQSAVAAVRREIDA